MKEKRKENRKRKGRWKEDSLRNVGRTDALTDARTYTAFCFFVSYLTVDRRRELKNYIMKK